MKKHLISERVGSCVYCGAPAELTCRLCGACVCEGHMHQTGVCSGCMRGKQIK